MSEISKRIDEVIACGLKKLMKEAGFRKKGRTFYRESDGIFEILNVQASIFNDSNEGTFTVNLGVFFPNIHELADSFEVKGVPNESECTLRCRIGSLFPDDCDHWWSVKPSTDIEGLGGELKNIVESLALPWLGSNKDITVASPLLKKQNKFIAVATYYIEGNSEEAINILQSIIDKGGPATSKAKYMAKQCGLIMA